jgi:hypothetical protein
MARPINRLTGVRLRDTAATEDRRRRADQARERLGLVPLLVVDPQGDPGWSALGRAPSAAFVIDASGRVAARQVWVDPQVPHGLPGIATSFPSSPSGLRTPARAGLQRRCRGSFEHDGPQQHESPSQQAYPARSSPGSRMAKQSL